MNAMEKLRMMAEQKKANILNTGVDPNGNPVQPLNFKVDMTGVNTTPNAAESQYMTFRSDRAAEHAWKRAQKELNGFWPNVSEDFKSWKKNFKLGNPDYKDLNP